MKILKLNIIAGIAMAIVSALTTAALASAPISNPALLYYQAFLLAPEPMPEPDMDYLYSKEGMDKKLPERYAKLYTGYDLEFGLLRAAASLTNHCDWGLNFNTGPGTLMPHLARSKAASIATRFRVMWLLQNGRQTEAADDLFAALVMARNVSKDGTLISTLVEFASEAISTCTIAANFGRFSPETLQQLLDRLGAAPPRGTVAGAIAGEKSFFHDRTVSRIRELQNQYPGDEPRIMASLRDYLDPMQPESDETNLWEKVSRAAGGSSQGLLTLLQERESQYDKLTSFLQVPYDEYRQQATAIRTQLETSANPFVAETLPLWLRARGREFKVQAYLAMVRAAVEYKLHGEPGLLSVTDPCSGEPFAFRRFFFQGVDRGFELKSAFVDSGVTGAGPPQVLIFVETRGPAFRIDGPKAGQPLPETK